MIYARNQADTIGAFKVMHLSSSLNFYLKRIVEMLLIDRYSISEAFYHKILLNMLEN